MTLDKDLVYAIGILGTLGLGIWNMINNFKSSKKTAFINTVTNERVKWLDKLRINISTFTGLTHTWTRSSDNDSKDSKRILEEIDKLRYLIRLQLNPKTIENQPNVDKRIEELLLKIPELTDPTERKNLTEAIEKLIVNSQELLKNEWDKVKEEAKKGELKNV